MEDETPSLPYKLPILTITNGSYEYVWQHRRLFVAPILVIFLLQLASSEGIKHLIGVIDVTGRILINLAILSTAFALSISLVVGVHRMVLRNEVRGGFAILRWDRDVLRYLGTWLLLTLLAFLINYLLVKAGGFLLGILMLLGINVFRFGLTLIPIDNALAGLLILRLALALPAAAIGQRNGPVLSWTAVRGNWIRFLAISLLTFLPYIATVSLRWIVPSLMIPSITVAPPTFLSNTLAAAVVAATLPVFAVMASTCFDALVRGGEPKQLLGLTSHGGIPPSLIPPPLTSAPRG